MVHLRRGTAAILVVPLAFGFGRTVAQADASSGSVLYVGSAGCSDSGGTSSSAPFCTIQQAADAAVAGDTVEIAAGTYGGAVVKSVGTASSPIVFKPVGGTVGINAVGPSLTFDGAANVVFEGSDPSAGITQGFSTDAIVVDDSSAVTLDGFGVAADGTALGAAAVHVTGGSTGVLLSRSIIHSDAAGVQIDSGGSGDAVTTNVITAATYALSVDGSTGAEITGNTVTGFADTTDAVALTDGATGASVENNIMAYPSGNTADFQTAILAVDQSSVTGTKVDYNVITTSALGLASPLERAYRWAGMPYAVTGTFVQSTGQGQHDSNADPRLYVDQDMASEYATAPEVNSADSAAPGALPTDLYGNSCGGDPVMPVTGTGSPAYCYRGAIQPQYATKLAATVSASGALSADVSTTISQTVKVGQETDNVLNPATTGVSYTVDWGDGTTSHILSHVYDNRGTYTVAVTADLSNGSQLSASSTVTTTGAGFVPLEPVRILDTRSGVGGYKTKLVAGQCFGWMGGVPGIALPSNATAIAANLTVTDTVGNAWVSVAGPGATVSNINYLKGQTKANSVVIPVASGFIMNVCSGGNTGAAADIIIDATGYFTQTDGVGFAPVTPARILDTRSGNGAAKAKVAAQSGIAVQIAGLDSIPAGVTAVAVHVTEVDATANGFIAAEPDGAGVPQTSSLNYLTGQTVSNTVIVPVGADGKIELYNGATSGSADLVADVSGYFSASAPAMYVSESPYRAWDTRSQGDGLRADDTETYTLGTATTPDDNVTVVANLTVVDAAGNGVVIAYPVGLERPGISTLNYIEGQTVSGLAVLPSGGLEAQVNVYNQSSGSTDLVLDVFGYFSAM